MRAIFASAVAPEGIAGAVDAGLEGATPYLALEYVSADSLDATLRAAGKLDSSHALAICRSLASAIDAAWDQGVGHGALHPRDVFVQETGVVVTGFGVIQALETVGLKAPVRRPYTAPERMRGEAWDRRADVYSLGAIARELAAVPGTALDRALAEHPEDRYSTASDMMDAISGAFQDDSETRFPDPIPENDSPTLIEPLHPVAAALIRPSEAIDLGATPPAVFTPPIAIEPPRTYPWAATVAVALAGLALGAVFGSVMGYRRGVEAGQDAAIAKSIADAAATADVSTPPVPTVQPEKAPAPVAAPKPQAPVSQTRVIAGAVDVDSRPRGASVTIDGRRVGQTPLRVPGLSPGDHRVLIELPGHKRVASTVKITAGTQTRLAVTLELAERQRFDP